MTASKLAEIKTLIDTQGRGVSDTPALFDALRALLPVVEALVAVDKSRLDYLGWDEAQKILKALEALE